MRNKGKGEGTGRSGARERVTSHLRQIVKRTAVAGAMIVAGACEACGTRGIVCDPLPPPMDGGADAGVDAGCMCADPLPPPLQCVVDGGPNLASILDRVHPYARWQLGDGGFWVAVEVVVTRYGNEAIAATGDPQVTGGALVSATPSPSGMTVLLLVQAGVTQVDVVVPLTCQGTAASAHLQLDVSQTPYDGGSIPVTIVR
jgi:hypothetical protein